MLKDEYRQCLDEGRSVEQYLPEIERILGIKEEEERGGRAKELLLEMEKKASLHLFLSRRTSPPTSCLSCGIYNWSGEAALSPSDSFVKDISMEERVELALLQIPPKSRLYESLEKVCAAFFITLIFYYVSVGLSN